MNETTVSVPTTSSPVNIVQFCFAEKIVMSCLLTIIILVGLIGNSMVCIIFVQNKKMRTISYCLVANLAVADMLQSVTITFMIVSLLNDGWVLSNAACQLTGFMNVSFVVTSLFSLAMISMQRCITVVRRNSAYILTKKHAKTAIAVSWLFPAFLATLPILVYSGYKYEPRKLICTFHFRESISMGVMFMLSIWILPFITISICTYKILKALNASRRRVGNSSVVGNQRRKHEMKVSMMLVVMIVCLIAFYTPAVIVNLIQIFSVNEHNLPYQADAWALSFAMFNHATNPIIYGLMNKIIRNSFQYICSVNNCT
eukprot:gene13783-15225_t